MCKLFLQQKSEYIVFQPIQTSRTTRTLSRLSGKFLHYPEIFQAIRKLSGPSRKYLDYPETFQTIQNLSRLSKNFPDNPETFQTIWKLSRRSGSFPVQFQSIRAKTFWTRKDFLVGNVDTLTRFSSSLVLFIRVLVISIRALALPLQAIVQLIRVLQLCPIFYPRPLERAPTTDCSRQDTAVTFFTISDKFSPFSVI